MSSIPNPAETDDFQAFAFFLKRRYPAPPPVQGSDGDDDEEDTVAGVAASATPATPTAASTSSGERRAGDDDALDSVATRVAEADGNWMKAAAIELIHWSDDIAAIDAARRFMSVASRNMLLLQQHRQLVDLSRERLCHLCRCVCDCVVLAVSKLDRDDDDDDGDGAPNASSLVRVDPLVEARVHALMVVMSSFVDGTRPELPLVLAEIASLHPRWRRFDIRAAAVDLLRRTDGAFPTFAHCAEVDASIKSLADHPENFLVGASADRITAQERRELHSLQTSLVAAIFTQRAEADWVAAALGRVMAHPFPGDVVANAVHQFQGSPALMVSLKAKRVCSHHFLFQVVPRAAELSLTPAFAKKCGNRDVSRTLKPHHRELSLVVRLTEFTKGTNLAHVEEHPGPFISTISRLVAAVAACMKRAVEENWPLANLGNHPSAQLLKTVAGYGSSKLMLSALQPLLRESEHADINIERVAAVILLSQAALEASPRLLHSLDAAAAARSVRRLLDPSQPLFYRSLGLRAAGSMAAMPVPKLPGVFFDELRRQMTDPALGGRCVGIIEGAAEGLIGYGRGATLLAHRVTSAEGRHGATVTQIAQRNTMETQVRDAIPWLVDLVIGLPASVPPCIARNAFIEAAANLTSRDALFVPTQAQIEALLRRSEAAAEHTRQLDRLGTTSGSKREERRLLDGLTTHVNGDALDLRKVSNDAMASLRSECLRVSEAETLVTFAAIFVSKEALVRVDHDTPAPIRKQLPLPAALARRFDDIAASRACVLEALAAMICRRRFDDRERGLVRKLHMCTIVAEGFSRALDRHPELAQRIVPLALEALDDRFNVSQSHTVRAQGMRLIRSIARAITVGPRSPVSCSLGTLVFDCIEELGYCLSFGGLPIDDPMSAVLSMSAVINHALIRAHQRASPSLAASLGAEYLPPERLRQHLWPLRRDVARLVILVLEIRRNDTPNIRSANVWMLERLRLFFVEMDRLETVATQQKPARRTATKAKKKTPPTEAVAIMPPLTDTERRGLFPQHVSDVHLVSGCGEMFGQLSASPTTAMNLANFIFAAATLIPPTTGPTPTASTINTLFNLGGGLQPLAAGFGPQPFDPKVPSRAIGILLLMQTALLRDPSGQSEPDLVAWHAACVDFLFEGPASTGGGDHVLTMNLAVTGAALSVLGLIAAAIEGGSVRCSRLSSWRPYAIAAKVCKRVFNSVVAPPDLDVPDAAQVPPPALFRSPVDSYGRSLRAPLPPRLPTDSIAYLPVASSTASPDNPMPVDLARACVIQLRAIQRASLTFVAMVASEPCVPVEAFSAMEQDIMPTLAKNAHALARILTAKDGPSALKTSEQRVAVTPCSMATGVSDGTEAAAALFGGRAGGERRQRLLAVAKEPSWLGAAGAKVFSAELKSALELAELNNTTQATAGVQQPKQRSRKGN